MFLPLENLNPAQRWEHAERLRLLEAEAKASRGGELNEEQRERFLAELNPEKHSDLITEKRETGNANYAILRKYKSGDAEACCLKLESGEQLRRGGGAKRKNTEKQSMDIQTLQKSRQRARTQVRRKCMSGGIDRMLTLTFKENVGDLKEAWQVFKYFSKLMAWRYKERWFYVCVPEFQQRGAVHFHLAISGFFLANTVRRFWLRASGVRGGNVDITPPRRIGKKSWNPRRIASYLSKYLTKHETVDFNGRRYSSGGKIPPPDCTRGWLALGLDLHRFFPQVFKEFTRKKIDVIWESDDNRGIFFCST